MKLAIRIALRYLFAKKSQNIINVISMISVAGVLVGTMALVVVLSVFNGLHGLIGSLYESFDPELKVVPVKGKVFSLEELPINEIRTTEGVNHVASMLEDQALLRFDKRQVPAIVMGVDENFAKVSGIDTIIVEGKYQVKYQKFNYGVAGYALADQLGLRLNFVKPLVIYAPKRTGQINMMRPDLSFNKEYLNPAGIFAVRQLEYDSKYLVINLDQARRLFGYQEDMVSSLGISVKKGYDINTTKAYIQQLVGNDFKVLDRHEQHATFYKLMQVEKLMAYLILLFILVIAFFNIIGTLSLLIFEKKESIGTLKSMGATRSLINKIFLTEGWMISLLGVLGGGFLGAILVWIQQQYGLLQFSGEGTFIVDAYPVELQWGDLVMVCSSVSIIGLLAAWYPVRVIVKSYYLGQRND